MTSSLSYKSEIQLEQRGLRLDLLIAVGATALGAVGVLMFDLPNGLVFGMAAGAIVRTSLRLAFVVDKEAPIRIIDILFRKYVSSLDDGAAATDLVQDFDRIRVRLWFVIALLAAIIGVNAASFAISGSIGSAIAVLVPSILAPFTVGFGR